jgi:CTP synthase (UTP-ammonia lyase)
LLSVREKTDYRELPEYYGRRFDAEGEWYNESTRNEERIKVKRTIKIGILGDFDPDKVSHPATNEAIDHAAGYLSAVASVNWLPTPSLLTGRGQKRLEEFDCLWASSGGPYKSTVGMLKGIQIARGLGRPFIGT